MEPGMGERIVWEWWWMICYPVSTVKRGGYMSDYRPRQPVRDEEGPTRKSCSAYSNTM